MVLPSFKLNRLENEGYYGGVRLLMAICKVFRNHCKDNDDADDCVGCDHDPDVAVGRLTMNR